MRKGEWSPMSGTKHPGILRKKPKGWRDTQTLMNFLYWLGHKRKGTPGWFITSGYEPRLMSDAFYIEDAELEKLYAKFLEEHQQ